MCSYCGCESISVIGRFMSQHEQIVNVCGALRRAARTDDAAAAAGHAVDNGLFPAAAVALDGPTWERVVRRTADPATAVARQQ